MKLAKKVLAIVMAIAMIGCLTAMAFAADNSKVDFVVGEVTDKGTVDVTVYLVDGVGATTVAFELEYDTAAVTKIAKKNGTDAKNIGDIDNAFSGEFNPSLAEKKTDTKSVASFAGYFKNENWSSADWAAADGADAPVNGEKFNFVTLTFTLADPTAPIEIKASGKVEFKDAAAKEFADVAITLAKKAEETTVAETTTVEETTTAVIETEAPTTAEANPNTGDKNTGDNMALAAAAGVVALAGAAFIISKKRK